MVGAAGFEPTTPSPPDWCATRLRHAPPRSAERAVQSGSYITPGDRPDNVRRERTLGSLHGLLGITNERTQAAHLLEDLSKPLATFPIHSGGPSRRAGTHRLSLNNGRHTAFFQQLLNPLDGVAVAVEQIANAAQQFDVLGTVVPPPAAALERLDLRKLRFPKAQNVLRDIQLPGNLTNRAEGGSRLSILSQSAHDCPTLPARLPGRH